MGVTDFKHWSLTWFEGSEEREGEERRRWKGEERALRDKWSGTSIYKFSSKDGCKSQPGLPWSLAVLWLYVVWPGMEKTCQISIQRKSECIVVWILDDPKGPGVKPYSTRWHYGGW